MQRCDTALLACQGLGTACADQALAQATPGGEKSRPRACLLLCPLVHWQLGQEPASQTGEGCSGCLSLLPACVPPPGFLLLEGLIKLKPLHKCNKKANAKSSRSGLTKKTPHQQDQRRGAGGVHFSSTQASSLCLQNDQEDGPRASKQPSLGTTPSEQLRRSPPGVPCRDPTALRSRHTPWGGRGHMRGHQGERMLTTHPRETLLVGFAFTYTAPPLQLPRRAPERQQIRDILHYCFAQQGKIPALQCYFE